MNQALGPSALFTDFQLPASAKRSALKKADTIAAMPGCRRISVSTNHNINGKMNDVGSGIGKRVINLLPPWPPVLSEKINQGRNHIKKTAQIESLRKFFFEKATFIVSSSMNLILCYRPNKPVKTCLIGLPLWIRLTGTRLEKWVLSVSYLNRGCGGGKSFFVREGIGKRFGSQKCA